MRDWLLAIWDAVADELWAMRMGLAAPYHRAAFVMAACTALAFSVALTHSESYEGAVAVIDLDATKASTELVESLNASPYVRVAEVLHAPVDPVALTGHDRALGTLFIPEGFEKAAVRGEDFSLGFLADYSNQAQNSGTTAAINAVVAAHNARQSGYHAPLKLAGRTLFNPVATSTVTFTVGFVYFFSSILLGTSVLTLVGRLKVSRRWEPLLLSHGPSALLARTVPYAAIYTAATTIVLACLVAFGQYPFRGHFLAYIPSQFATATAICLTALLFSWDAKNPGSAVGRMILFIPPGFILGNVTMTIGFFPAWVQAVKYAFPLVWQYEFLRDCALRGAGLQEMAAMAGAHLLYLSALCALVCLLYIRARGQALRRATRSSGPARPAAA